MNSAMSESVRKRLHNMLQRGAMVLVALAVTAISATGQSVREISFEEALQIALSRNINLQLSENSRELQQENVRSARAAYLPNLNLNASPGQQYGLAFDQTAGKLVSETSESLSLGVSSSVSLFDGFGRQSQLSQSRYNLEAADHQLERSRQEVLSQVALNFLQVMLDREQIRVQNENLVAQNQLLTRIREFVDVGSRPISDLYQQEAAVAQSELQLLTAERSYQLSQNALIRVLQLDPVGNYEFTAPSAEGVNLIPREFDLQDLFDRAYQQRSDLMAQRASIEASEQGIRLAKSSMYPSLSLSGNARTVYSSQRQQFDPVTGETSGIPFADQLTDNRGGGLGLSVRIPIFNRFSTSTAVQRAQVQHNNALLDYEAAQQQVALEVRQSYLDYLTAVKQLDVTEKQLRSAEQALDAEQERYNLQASTLVELSQARATYEQSVADRLTAIYTFLTRGKLIEFYTGIIDPTESIFE